MAISNSNPRLLPLIFFLTFFLLLLSKVKSTDSVYFNFPNFSSKDDITFQGDASLSKRTLQLTDTNESGVPYANPSQGRASYSKPVRIWKRSTGSVASFATTFSFVIKPPPPESGSLQAEGLAFFIAPVGFDIPNNSDGKYLTLFNDTTALKPFMNQIVAVEFDTHPNPELSDPPNEHIGIDINSIESAKTVQWGKADVKRGSKAKAKIEYNAVSKILTVELSYFSYLFPRLYKLEHEVDFTSFLPEWVTVGFSGATGWGAETHNVLSWEFKTCFTHRSPCYISAHSAV